jgi:hypothetical protein
VFSSLHSTSDGSAVLDFGSLWPQRKKTLERGGMYVLTGLVFQEEINK